MVDGLIITNKPEGMTSFQMVAKIKREYNEKKVGHIGTLDPLAEGVLPILLGKATKLSDLLMNHTKEYYAVVKLGQKSDTGDREGKKIEEKLVPDILKMDLNTFLKENFIGEQEQIPPIYSAIKVKGKKLYQYARDGEKVDISPRKITINEIKFEKIISDNSFSFTVNCSKGTYIRSLCEDIADKLDTVGYMEKLVRTKVGKYSLSDEGKFIKMEDILDIPRIEVDDIQIKKLLNGIEINFCEKDSLVNIYQKDRYIGIGQVNNNLLKRKIIAV